MKNKFFLIIILSAMSLFIGCETYSGDSYDFSNSKNGQYVDFLTKQSEKIKVGLEVKIPVEKRTSSSSSDITITLKLKGKKVDTTIIDTIKRLEKKVVFNYLVPIVAENDTIITTINSAIAQDGSEVSIGRIEGKIPTFTIICIKK